MTNVTGWFSPFGRYYSMYGHVEKLAEEITKGAASVEGVEAKLWQVDMRLAPNTNLKKEPSAISDMVL